MDMDAESSRWLPTRRSVLVGLGASLAARSVRASEGQVVIIGAGAAGLAASMDLTARGIAHVVIEAADRIGGRAYTETATFGVPCDVGAHWLHNGGSNPLVGYARSTGVRIYDAPERWELFDGAAWLERDAEEAVWDALEAVESALERAGDRGLDVAAGSVVPSATSSLVRFLAGPYEHAASLNRLSTMDWYRQEEGSDMFCDGGLGALVAAWGTQVPVSLGTEARRIDWSGPGVVVETNKGALRAAAAIVTVPTQVLAEGGVRFAPALPDDTERAIRDLPLGSYNHVVLQFEDDPFGLAPDTMVGYAGRDGEAGLLVDAGGTGLTYLDVAGDAGAALAAEGEDAMVAFARMALRDMVGADGVAALRFAKAFPWEANPLAGGAYSAARPGRADARTALRVPVADRLFFAGEATSVAKPATVDGAIEEGGRAAQQVAAQAL